MNPGVKKALHVIAAIWIIAGLACYCYAFTRDFYAANKHRIDTALSRFGM